MLLQGAHGHVPGTGRLDGLHRRRQLLHGRDDRPVHARRRRADLVAVGPRGPPAVPSVASTVKPWSTSRLTGKIMARLSRFATETNTVPPSGRLPYAAC